MKKIRFIIGKIDTIGSCVVSNQTPAEYSDTIVKDQVYNNVTTKTIKLKNICAQDFTVPAKIIFSQEDAQGSTFSASINAINVPANSEVDVPVYYNGIYKGSNLNPSFPFTINGINMMYNLTVSVPAPVSNIQIINPVIDHQMGYVTFDVVVTGTPFVGYANGLLTNGTVNSNQIVGSIYTPAASMALKIIRDRPVGSEDRRSIPVNIPVGTYSGNMQIGANPVPIEEYVSVTLFLSFALTDVYEDGIMGAVVTLPYDREAVVTPPLE